jgi:signal transduction histidine kinase/ActR/RegA family two-component response regulator
MLRSMLKSLRLRLVGLVLLAVVPALVLVCYSGIERRRLAIASAGQRALQTARLISTDHQRVIESTQQVLVSLARLPAFQDSESGACPAWLADLSSQQPMYLGVAVATPQGDVVCNTLETERPVSLADRDWFQQVIETQHSAVSAYQVGRLSGQPVIVVGQPVVNEAAELRAVLSVGLDLSWFDQRAAEADLPDGSAFTLLDQNGMVLARYPDGDSWAGQTRADAPLLHAMLAMSGSGVTEAPGLDGERRFYAFTPLSGTPAGAGEALYLAVGIPRSVVLREANWQLARDLALLGLVAVLAVEAAWFAGGRSLARPVENMVRAAERLAAGDLNAHTGLDDSLGEMGRLAGAFDRMAASLRQREAERERAEQNLQRANRALRVLSIGNHTVLRARDEQQLLKAMCNVIVKAGGYSLAWVGLAQQDDEEGVQVAAFANGEGGSADPGAGRWLPERQDKDYAITAMRTAAPVIHRNGAIDPSCDGEKDGASHCRHAAALALPLVTDRETLGVLGICAAQPEAFEQDEVRLLEELADDVAYGISNKRVHAEWEWTREALEESEQQYRMLFHEMLSGFALYEVVYDGDGRPYDYRLLMVNPAFERLTGMHARDVIGRTVQETPPEEPFPIEHWYDQVALTGQPLQFEGYSAALGRYYETRAFCPGRGRLAVMFQDTTERNRAEQALLQQLTRTSLLNQIARSIAERQDLASILRVVVTRLEEELAVNWGCAATYDPNRNVFIVTVCGKRAPSSTSDVGLAEGTIVSAEQAWLAPVLDGELVHVPDATAVDEPLVCRLASLGVRSIAATPLMVEGQLLGALFTSRMGADGFGTTDLDFLRAMSEHVAVAAHQARLHQDLRVAYDDLRRTQEAAMEQERLRALGEMASGIAHDINNAISPAVIFAELLRREPSLNARARQMVDDISASCTDVSQMLARLRQFYREPEAEVMAPVDLNQAVQQVIALTRPRWHDMPLSDGIVITMQTELSPDLPAVMGVESEVREALTNLVLNAVDAMPAGGTLQIRTHSNRWADTGSPAYMVVEVNDTGTGMDEETRKRCLEPFFTTKGNRGTGLGLSVVHGTMQRHEGHLEINSAPGQGTSIRLLFPLRALVDSDEAPCVGVGPGTSLHILYVDDEPVLRRALAEMLVGDGHTVEVADSGRSGIEAFQAARERGEPFDVVITDLGMPHVSGRDVARAIKRDAPATQVILLTGWGRSLNGPGETPPHVDCVLCKPPRIEELRHAMASVCEDHIHKQPA